MTDEELRERVIATEAYWRAQYPNYDLVLHAAGILAAITRHPDGTRPDPVLAELLFRAADPAKTAYDHALVRLSQRGTIPCVVCGHPARSPVSHPLAALRRAVWVMGLVSAAVLVVVWWVVVYG